MENKPLITSLPTQQHHERSDCDLNNRKKHRIFGDGRGRMAYFHPMKPTPNFSDCQFPGQANLKFPTNRCSLPTTTNPPWSCLNEPARINNY